MLRTKTELIAAVKACRELEEIRVVHATAIRLGQDSDLYVANSLCSVYGACACLVQQNRVFDGMRYRSVVSWNVLILGHVNNGELISALELYTSMQREGLTPDALTLVAALKACTGLALQAKQRGHSLHSVLLEGKALQSHGSALGLCSHALVASYLVNFYAICGSLLDARRLFDESVQPEPLLLCAWNSLLLAYAENDDGETSLDLFGVLLREKKITVNSVTFYAAFKACESIATKEPGKHKLACLDKVKGVHSQAKEHGFDTEAHVAGILVRLYTLCGDMVNGRQVFDKTPWHTTVWNSLIRWHTENGEPEIALQLFSSMQVAEPDAFTYVLVLKAYTARFSREKKQLLFDVNFDKFSKINELMDRRYEQDVFITSGLINLYAECGSMVDARRVFERFPGPECLVLWNALLLGYANNGDGESVFELFGFMRFAPDAVTYVALSKACASVPLPLQHGKFVHSLVVRSGHEPDVKVANSIVDMYSRCCSLVGSVTVFDGMADHTSVVSWTSLILGHAEQGEALMALKLYVDACMQTVPDSQLYAAALKACTSLAVKEESCRSEMLSRGRQILHQAVEQDKLDSFLAGCFADLCIRCGEMETAMDNLKDEVSSAVAWASLMLGYVDNGQPELALEVYCHIGCAAGGCHVQTYGAALKACGRLLALNRGLAVQGAVYRCGFEDEKLMRNSALDIHCKCGSMIFAQSWFDALSARDSVSWNTLLTGYSRTTDPGSWNRVAELLKCMVDEGFNPTAVSFAAVLNACSHGGLVEAGKTWFESMTVYGVVPDQRHYNSIVDILARANRLDEALAIAETIPGGADVKTWTSILGACTKWKNSLVAKVAFEALVKLDEKATSVYSLLANSCLILV